MDSGPDLIEMFKKEPELALLIRYGKTRFYPMHDGRGHLDWIPEINSTEQSSYNKQALQDFMILITNPLWRLLGGPCVRCGDYYLKRLSAKRFIVHEIAVQRRLQSLPSDEDASKSMRTRFVVPRMS
jgi:hypothetical protein